MCVCVHRGCFVPIILKGAHESHIHRAASCFPWVLASTEALAFAASIFFDVTEGRESEVHINVSLFLTWNLHSSVPCNANPAAVLD